MILLLDLEVAGLEDRGCFARGIGGRDDDDEEEEGKECLKAEGFSEASISREDTVWNDDTVDDKDVDGEDEEEIEEDGDSIEGDGGLVKEISCLNPAISVGACGYSGVMFEYMM